MPSPPIKLIGAAFAKERTIDTALSGVGVSAAFVSAAFAAYMVVVGPEPGARGDRPPLSALSVPNHAPLLAGGSAPVRATTSDGIDFAPTGSLAALEPAPPRKTAPADAVLTDFAVRDVFDGTALVEANGSLQMVNRGATLEGAGEILAIERQRGVWVIKATGGTIRQRR